MIILVKTPKLGEQSVLIDDEDRSILEDYSLTLWTSKRHYGIYVIAYLKGKNKAYKLHRIIMDAKPGEIVDHINGNPLDNRKENLRITTSLVNNQNARKRKDGVTSKYKGVSWCGQAKKWKAQIQHNKVKKSLGFFLTEEEARQAYLKFCKDNNIVTRS